MNMKKVVHVSGLLPLLSIVYLAASMVGSGAQAVGNAMPAAPKFVAPASVGFHGLDLDLNAWTNGFSGGLPKTPAPLLVESVVASAVVEAFNLSRDLSSFYQRLLKLKYNQPSAQSEDYLALARGLLSARRELRPSPFQNGNIRAIGDKRRGGILLLQVLAEETLYVGAMRFTEGFPRQGDSYFSAVYELITDKECFLHGQSRRAELNGINLCQGDVLLSKGGALSSSFLARVTAYPGNFSHATTVYVSNDPAKPLFQLPESEMEDGVKLRDPQKDYVNSRKRKLFVYRARAAESADRPEAIGKMITGVDAYKAEMDKLTGGKAEELTSFHYDFKFFSDDPNNHFCSAVVRDVGKRGDLLDDLNPYPPKLFSTVVDEKTDPSGSVSAFFTDAMAIPNLRFPAPSDIELNPNFELTALQIDTARLASDRVDVAIMDILFAYLKANAQVMKDRYFTAVKDIGNDPVTPADVQKFRELGIIEDKYLALVEKQLPDGANIKQVLFFGLMNEVLGKDKPARSLRTQVLEAHDAYVKKSGRPMSLGALRAMILKHVDEAARGFLARKPMISEQLGGFVAKLGVARDFKAKRKADAAVKALRNAP